MRITVLMSLMILLSMTSVDRGRSLPVQVTQQSSPAVAQSGQIKITIATSGGPYPGPAKDSFRVGESVPLVITMTNTGSQPVYVCESDSLYQDRPRLLRDGQPFPYKSYRQDMLQLSERDATCKDEDLPQQTLLRPNEPTVVDWSNLGQGRNSLNDDGWYEPLPVGKYTLTDRRRLTCCDGPFIESNTINFVVTP